MNEMLLELMVIITERNEGEKLAEKINKVTFQHSIVRGSGTADSALLAALGLGEPEKDLVFCFCENKNICKAYKLLEIEQKLEAKRKLVAFTIPLSAVGGSLTLKLICGQM